MSELCGIFGHSAGVKELLVGVGNSPLHVGNWVSEHPEEECSWETLNVERQTKARQTPGLEEPNRSGSSSEEDSGPSIRLVHRQESEPQTTGQIPPCS